MKIDEIYLYSEYCAGCEHETSSTPYEKYPYTIDKNCANCKFH